MRMLASKAAGVRLTRCIPWLGTLNSAEWFGLHDRGALAPGRRADFWTFPDLDAPAAAPSVSGVLLPAVMVPF